MKPLFITIGTKLPLMVIPDSQAHLDGHAVLTYTYSIYRNIEVENSKDIVSQKEAQLHLEQKDDLNYLGIIAFEVPDKLFTYTAGENERLDSDQVQEIIGLITEYRDTPSMWSI